MIANKIIYINASKRHNNHTKPKAPRAFIRASNFCCIESIFA